MGCDVAVAKVTNSGSGIRVLVVEQDPADCNKHTTKVLMPRDSSVNSVEAFGIMDEKGNFLSASMGSESATFWKIRDGAEVEVRGTFSLPLIEPKGLGLVPGMVTPSTPDQWLRQEHSLLVDSINGIAANESVESRLTGALADYLNANFSSATAAQLLAIAESKIELARSNQTAPEA